MVHVSVISIKWKFEEGTEERSERLLKWRKSPEDSLQMKDAMLAEARFPVDW